MCPCIATGQKSYQMFMKTKNRSYITTLSIPIISRFGFYRYTDFPIHLDIIYLSA